MKCVEPDCVSEAVISVISFGMRTRCLNTDQAYAAAYAVKPCAGHQSRSQQAACAACIKGHAPVFKGVPLDRSGLLEVGRIVRPANEADEHCLRELRDAERVARRVDGSRCRRRASDSECCGPGTNAKAARRRRASGTARAGPLPWRAGGRGSCRTELVPCTMPCGLNG